MYSSVPITEPAAVCVVPSSTERAMPKSMISASPPSGTGPSAALSIMMFSGLRSRWTTPFSCAAARPCAICCAIWIARAQRQRARAAQQLRQRLAFDERHRQVLDAVDLAEVVNADDVLVGDLAREHQLALEALLELFRGGGVRLRRRTDHLDRHRHAQLVIERLVDGAHAAGAEQLQDRVARTDLLPGLERAIAGAHGRARRRTVERRRERRRIEGRRPCVWKLPAAGVGGLPERRFGIRRIGGRTPSLRAACRSSGRTPFRGHRLAHTWRTLDRWDVRSLA